jgi:hypothetical protein
MSGTKYRIDTKRALELKRRMTWAQVGEALAKEVGRPMPFTMHGVKKAIRTEGQRQK